MQHSTLLLFIANTYLVVEKLSHFVLYFLCIANPSSIHVCVRVIVFLENVFSSFLSLALLIGLFFIEKQEMYTNDCKEPILTLDDIDRHPELISSCDYFQDLFIYFRPLLRTDDKRLATFLENLSEQTRQFSTRESYDLDEAQSLCSAINRYDKLRLVALIDNDLIIALFEFSLSIVDNDHQRFKKYNIQLNELTDARFGPCISDQYQNRQLGYWLFEKTKTIARQMGKERLILWGGVRRDNQRAIRFYEKIGFELFSDDQWENRDGILDLLERKN